MNAQGVGLETEMVGYWASDTPVPLIESSFDRPSESRTAPGETERSLQVFDPSERFSTENVTELPETDFAHVHDVESTRKHPEGEETLEESKSESAVESGLENVSVSPVPLVNDAEDKIGYVMGSAVTVAEAEAATVDSSPFDFRTTT